MAYNIHDGTKLTSTGQIAGKLSMYGGKRKKSSHPAIRPHTVQPKVAFMAAGSGKSLQFLAMKAAVELPKRAKSRWHTQSIRRSIPAQLLGKNDRGFGAVCPVRVIRDVIHVGRPEYQGAGVWA